MSETEKKEVELPRANKNRRLVIGGWGYGVHVFHRCGSDDNAMVDDTVCYEDKLYFRICNQELEQFRKFCTERGIDPKIQILYNAPYGSYDIICERAAYEEFMREEFLNRH